MTREYVIDHDVYVREHVNRTDSPTSESDASTTQYYARHLQKVEERALRYSDYDVKSSGKRAYRQRGFITPEPLAVKLHIRAFENGVLTPSTWKRFAQKILERLGLGIYYARRPRQF